MSYHMNVLPYSGFHLAVIQLMVVHLSKKREEHLDPTDGVDGTVDGVSHCGFYILWGEYKSFCNNIF